MNSDPQSKDEETLSKKDDFLSEQMGKFSEIFAPPIGHNRHGAPYVEPEKKNRWFEPPAPQPWRTTMSLEKAPVESAESPIAPAPPFVSAGVPGPLYLAGVVDISDP